MRAFAGCAPPPGTAPHPGPGPKPDGTAAAQAECTTRHELGVGAHVDLSGYADDPYASCRGRVFILSSAWEGFGNALAEGLACGCPVVTTDCPSGPAEILDRPLWATVPVGDDAAMAEAMAQMLDAPPDRDFLRRRGSTFTVERAADAYLDALFGNAAA